MKRPKREGPKTEVLFVFERHTGEQGKKVRELAKDYDAILFEFPHSKVRELAMRFKEKPKEEIEKTTDGPRMKQFYLALKEAVDAGKMVYGIDPLHDIEKKIPYDRAPWELTTLPREDEIYKAVKQAIGELRDKGARKILVNLGAFHTSVYHKIRRDFADEIEQGRMGVNRIFLTESELDGKWKMIYSPKDAFQRYAIFKRPKDKKTAKKLQILYDSFGRWFSKNGLEVINQTRKENPKASLPELFEIVNNKLNQMYTSIWKGFAEESDKMLEEIDKIDENEQEREDKIQKVVDKYIKKWVAEEKGE